jgi:diguanylate cyclase (GGDEF)-like protein
VFVTVGYSDNPDSVVAGRHAAQIALSKANREERCDLVLLFCTARHNQRLLRNAVAEVVGNKSCIYGGGAVGVITNEYFGYAGDQVGIALFWFEDSKCTILTEEGLQESERKTGVRLGERLAQIGTTQVSPVVLFYDAIDRSKGDLRLLMATWLLDGLENGLGFLPDLIGAGMQGDHLGSETQQYFGNRMSVHSAIALTFSDDIQMNSVIMHGCHPASPYYTVTKADGPVILEINGKPALQFMDELLGSAISQEYYPFFLLLGINQGERWSEYDENNYASRLCLGIDKERNGIVMFEPDMVEGTEFRLMYRSLDLDYMKPKINALFEQIDGQEALFAMYIDCAGRCAGYGGVDMEDAILIQEAVDNRIPLLGIYTGVEIASIGGRPRGLDWTGVFCIFTKKKAGKGNSVKHENKHVWNRKNIGIRQNREIPLDAVVKLCEQNAAKILSLDAQSISIRHELEQKRRGFGLLSELSVYLQQGAGDDDIFLHVTQRINSALNMQRTVVLFPNDKSLFVPHILQGYPEELKEKITELQIKIDASFLEPESPVLVTAADDDTKLSDFREILKLEYFISTPIVVKNEVVAILITGRMTEAVPFLSRLSLSDVETVQAISTLLASAWVYRRWNDADKLAQTDGLTGLLNRGALELQTIKALKNCLSSGKICTFIIIDLDHFKQVNDTYGHLEGDAALKALAQALRQTFRATDIVARIGGDEFAVFCTFCDNVEQITRRVSRLIENWNHTPLVTTTGAEFYSSLSIGISVAPHNGTTYTELFQSADNALYCSKQRGRNQFTVSGSDEAMSKFSPT